MPTVLKEKPSPGVTKLQINRPDVLNALNMEVRHDLDAALGDCAADPEVRVVVLTGNDKAFAAGADIKEMAKAGPVELHALGIEQFWQNLADFPKPLIAAVNGYALGGGFELALACDILIVGENAQLGLPEVRLGIMPGGGGTQRLLRASGKYATLRYVMTGDRFSGTKAGELGVASEVVEDGQVLERAAELADSLAALPPLALAKIKESVLLGMEAPLNAALKHERSAYYLLHASDDKFEGMAAFLEKRPGKFTGK